MSLPAPLHPPCLTLFGSQLLCLFRASTMLLMLRDVCKSEDNERYRSLDQLCVLIPLPDTTLHWRQEVQQTWFHEAQNSLPPFIGNDRRVTIWHGGNRWAHNKAVWTPITVVQKLLVWYCIMLCEAYHKQMLPELIYQVNHLATSLFWLKHNIIS